MHPDADRYILGPGIGPSLVRRFARLPARDGAGTVRVEVAPRYLSPRPEAPGDRAAALAAALARGYGAVAVGDELVPTAAEGVGRAAT